jgi:hypothetical protein
MIVVSNYLPPMNWRWVEEGDGHVGHCSPLLGDHWRFSVGCSSAWSQIPAVIMAGQVVHPSLLPTNQHPSLNHHMPSDHGCKAALQASIVGQAITQLLAPS